MDMMEFGMDLTTEVIMMNASDNLESGTGNMKSPLLTHILIPIDILELSFAILGNSFVLMAIWKYDVLRTTSNAFIANLAIADLLAVLMYSSFLVLYTAIHDTAGHYLPYILLSLRVFECINNMCGIGLIGLERLIYIVSPLRYPYVITKLKVAFMVCGMYMFSLTFSALLVLNMKVGKASSLPFDAEGSHSSLLAAVTFALVQYLVLIIFYALIFRIAYVRQAEMAQYRGEDRSHSAFFKIFKMAVSVLGIYVLCTLPKILSILFLCTGALTQEDYIMYGPLFDAFWNLNTCLNPVVYVHQNQDFRKAFLKMVPCSSGQISNSKSKFGQTSSSNKVMTKSNISGMQQVSSI